MLNMIHIWLTLATLLVAAELLTGTFYLLAIAVGAAAGAAATGLSLPLQLLIASSVAAACVLLVRALGLAPKKGEAAEETERGQPVALVSKEPLRVRYRGALWDAAPASPLVDVEAPLVIEALDGITLRVTNPSPSGVGDR